MMTYIPDFLEFHIISGIFVLIIFILENPLKIDSIFVETKILGKIYHAESNQETYRMAIQRSNKVDFKTKIVVKNQRTFYNICYI